MCVCSSRDDRRQHQIDIVIIASTSDHFRHRSAVPKFFGPGRPWMKNDEIFPDITPVNSWSAVSRALCGNSNRTAREALEISSGSSSARW